MSSKVKPAVAIMLDRERHLLFDFNAFAAMEEAGKKNVFQAKTAEELKSFSAIEFRLMVWAGLRHEDKALTLEDVGAMLTMDKLLEVGEKIAEAMEAAMPDEEEKGETPLAAVPPPSTGELPGP